MSYDHYKTTLPEDRHGASRDREPQSEPDPTRCLHCWREVYGSFPNKPLCREHFYEEQQRSIAAMVASHQKAS